MCASKSTDKQSLSSEHDELTRIPLFVFDEEDDFSVVDPSGTARTEYAGIEGEIQSVPASSFFDVPPVDRPDKIDNIQKPWFGVLGIGNSNATFTRPDIFLNATESSGTQTFGYGTYTNFGPIVHPGTGNKIPPDGPTVSEGKIDKLEAIELEAEIGRYDIRKKADKFREPPGEPLTGDKTRDKIELIIRWLGSISVQPGQTAMVSVATDYSASIECSIPNMPSLEGYVSAAVKGEVFISHRTSGTGEPIDFEVVPPIPVYMPNGTKLWQLWQSNLTREISKKTIGSHSNSSKDFTDILFPTVPYRLYQPTRFSFKARSEGTHTLIYQETITLLLNGTIGAFAKVNLKSKPRFIV